MSGVSLPKAYFIAMFCEAILHGMYTVLAGGALYLLLRKSRKQRMARTNLVMTALTVLMYCMSTVHVAMALRVDLMAFFDQHAIEGGLSILEEQGDPLIWGQICLELINCLLGDSIVCWRTWVLWGGDWRILVFPVACITGGVASGIGMTVALSRSPAGGGLFVGSITTWFAFFGALSFVANMYSVVMISWKAWKNLRVMKNMNASVTGGGKYYSALLLIIESGATYCIAVVVTIVLFLGNNNGVYVIADMLNHLTGIYPTIIIVLVCLKITFHDDMTRAEMQSRARADAWADPRRAELDAALSWRVAGNSRDENGTDTFASERTAGSLKPKLAAKTDEGMRGDAMRYEGGDTEKGGDVLEMREAAHARRSHGPAEDMV
ncbi:uncharacterized protein BXZ73DRAFT_100671 [Epithele typhae]|uniref:uncharacterized protein n=1 Tax=Epithele typhae TaxID=378194 RepID=UPI002007D6D0|nr:uncharacterized protein BXZ73DRAFT_100671 [Epithele typhae]KAH9934479.1 hypothetical protein BXZ73DRAFT_100671 [Epithele typhae]